MSPVQEIPVVPTARAVINEPVRLVGGLHTGRAQLRGPRREDARADGKRAAEFLPHLLRTRPIVCRSFIDDIRVGEERLIRIHHRTLGLPLPIGLHGFPVAPETGERMRIDGVVDIDSLHGLRIIRRNDDSRHAVGRLEFQLQLGRLRHLECSAL